MTSRVWCLEQSARRPCSRAVGASRLLWLRGDSQTGQLRRTTRSSGRWWRPPTSSYRSSTPGTHSDPGRISPVPSFFPPSSLLFHFFLSAMDSNCKNRGVLIFCGDVCSTILLLLIFTSHFLFLLHTLNIFFLFSFLFSCFVLFSFSFIEAFKRGEGEIFGVIIDILLLFCYLWGHAYII